MDEFDEREEELSSLSAIFPELAIDSDDKFAATLDLAVTPLKPLLVRFLPTAGLTSGSNGTHAQVATGSNAYIEHDIEFSHLPPLHLRIKLPEQYPSDSPPTIQLSAQYDWLSQGKLAELEAELPKLWEEYGHTQILFAYIDFLQLEAERGFDLDQSAEGCLVLSTEKEEQFIVFEQETKTTIFNTGTYDCGVCLYPKPGSACHQFRGCGHIFCRQCLQDFFNSAITEGDVSSVQCLAPDCGKVKSQRATAHSIPTIRPLQPRELLSMGIAEDMVRRYVDLKRSKLMSADKSTIYCPRTWCQGAARSDKYPVIPADLASYVIPAPVAENGSDGDASHNKISKIMPDPSDRLVVCEKCQLAFCKVCYSGWHGTFARCFPRDPTQLSAEDKASYDYIRAKTSPCPTCACPVQKTMGCNHMTCVMCRTHFCYLCGAWLIADNPYLHFNKPGTDCYQRIWEADADEEQAAGNEGAVGNAMQQLAIEAARDAEAQEAAARIQAEEEARIARAAARPDSAQRGRAS